MEIKDELRNANAEYRVAAMQVDVTRREYDATRRTLKEQEQSLFYEGTIDGRIDGKNAETRDAQALILFRANPDWQKATDAARTAEEAYRAAQAGLDIAVMNLKVIVVLANLELGSMAMERLATKVELTV